MAQLTLEFLLCFAISMAVIIILSSSLSSQISEVKGRAGEYEAISRSESAARAIEAIFAGGIEARADFRDEGVRYRIEGGNLHVEHGMRVVEIRGVFENDGSEPV